MSAIVPSQGPDLTLSYLLSFVAKTVTVNNPVPDLLFLNPYGISQGILMKGHYFVLLGLCPFIVKEIKGFANRLNALFVSPSNTRRGMSKNGISFYLRKVINDSGALVGQGVPPPRAHSIKVLLSALHLFLMFRSPGC